MGPRRRVDFRTDGNDMCFSLFGGRLRFKGDGSSYCGFGCRAEPDDDCCITPRNMTPNPPVNHVVAGCDSPQKLPVRALRDAASSENAVDTVKEISASIIAVDSSSKVGVWTSDNDVGFCG